MNFKINKLTTLVLIFALMLTSLFTLTSFAETTASYPEGTIIIELDSDGKPTGTPENWSYDSGKDTLTLNKGHTFAVNGECTAIVENKGTIEGGTFNGKFTNNSQRGIINNGIFNGDCVIQFYSIVNNGTFYGKVENIGDINNGTFNGDFINKSAGRIYGGVFKKECTNSGTINGGTFTLTFELNGGEWTSGYTAPATYTYGSELALPTSENISNGELVFDGWYAEADFSGVTLTTIPKTAGGSLKYYACFLDPSKINTWKTAGEKAQKDTDYTVDENGNYSVLTAKGLAKIANIVNDGDSLEGKTVTLVNDIDMLEGGVEGYGESTIVLRNSWIPISSFGGTFDGNNKKISNLYIYTYNTNAGLFNSNYGTVKNLEIASGKVKLIADIERKEVHAGAVCASSSGIVENCVNRVEVCTKSDGKDANTYIGGIVGLVSTTKAFDGFDVSKVINCKNYGSVSALDSQSSQIACGGIAGYQYSGSNDINGVLRTTLIEKCLNEGKILSGMWCGGIVGVSNGINADYAVVNNCENKASVNGVHSGGIIGLNKYQSKCCDNFNSGSVTGTTNAGGIAGINHSVLTGCYNLGSVSGTTCNGGIVGSTYSNVDNCYNKGGVKGGTYSGGIVGKFVKQNNNTYVVVTNCYNTGEVKEGKSVGGILGLADKYVHSDVANCYNTGNITGTTNAGGVVGLINSNTTGYFSMANCYNIGSVSGATNNGGVVGNALSGNVKNCYHLNSIENACGKINNSKATVENCYSFESQNKVHTLASAVYETTDLLTALKMWVKEKNDSGYLSWIANEQNDNYPQFLQKIQVKASINTAKETYFTIDFDTALENLKSENFVVTDGENEVTLTGITASEDNKTYTLSGSFEVGKTYTVTIKYVSETHKISNEKLTFTVASTPATTTSGTSRYTVRFVTNGGSSVSSQKVVRKNTVKEPAEPTKKDCAFEGWYSDKELTEKYDFSKKVLGNITLYAKWSEAEKEEAENNKIILTINEKTAVVFGKKVENDVAPIIKNDRTMLPSRFVAESLGAMVEWNEEMQQVTITKDDITIVITIGADKALVNGEEITIDSPAFIENDRTYTPIRFISEELGATVEWNENDQTVTITK